jgi:hypothetical protein
MQYFFNPKKKNTAAHIWVNGDTACRMLSTGGIKKGKKVLHEDHGDRRVCLMCQNNYAKNKK